MEKVTKSTRAPENQNEVCREYVWKDKEISLLRERIQILQETIQVLQEIIQVLRGEVVSRQTVSMTVVSRNLNPVDGGKGNLGNLSLVC